MYTSFIGKKFIALYNQQEGKDLTAKDFFENVFFELFFEDESHLMHVGNSPFFQKPKEEDVKKSGGKALAQLNNLRNNIETDAPNMAIYVGYAAKDIQGTTSGQVSSIDVKTDANDMYASWIGQALGVGVQGGFVMLLDRPEILLAVYEGWKYYRMFLTQSSSVKDKQIETWNGHWLCHRIGKNYHPDDPLQHFHLETENVLGKIAIPTNKWVSVVFALAQQYPDTMMTAYCYNLSQTNTTLGFINLLLPQVSEMYELRDRIFINEQESILSDEQIVKMETQYKFKYACALGAIGIKALEPDKLRTYMPKGSISFAEGKDYKFTNEESFFNYQLFKLWIIAMLNKTELLTLAAHTAKALLDFETKGKTENRGKTNQKQASKEVRDSKNLREFIEKLTEILAAAPEHADTLKEVVEQVLKMPSDNFPLFVTLIRFEYQYLQHHSSPAHNQ